MADSALTEWVGAIHPSLQGFRRSGQGTLDPAGGQAPGLGFLCLDRSRHHARLAHGTDMKTER